MGRRVRCDPDAPRPRPGAEGARFDRERDLQWPVDDAPYAVSDAAGRRRAGRVAGRHPAGRPAPRRPSPPRYRALGRAPIGSAVMSAPNRLSAAEAVAQLGSGAVTAEALARACLDRAREREDVKAWIWLDPGEAL